MMTHCRGEANMRKWTYAIAALIALAAAAPAKAAPPPRVIATIKPIHSLVAMVMQGVGEPQLLIGTSASPHTYSLKPTDARALQQAEVIFWVGEDVETFLEKPLRSLPKDARVVTLSRTPGVSLLSSRDAGAWEAHEHGGHHEDHDHDHDHAHGHSSAPSESRASLDMHIWLDVANAQAIVSAIAAALSEADAGRAATYKANAEQAVGRLQDLDESLRQKLTPLAGKPYIVFHDAYQYLEHRYGLSPAGSITINPDRQPSAQRVAAIRSKITSGNALCVFTEPQFEPKLVQTLIAGTKARTGVLDPDGGVGIAPGPEAYPTIMRNLAESLRHCLDPSS